MRTPILALCVTTDQEFRLTGQHSSTAGKRQASQGTWAESSTGTFSSSFAVKPTLPLLEPSLDACWLSALAARAYALIEAR